MGEELLASMNLMIQILQTNSPRRIDATYLSWNYLFVDASFEPDGHSGIGGVLYDSTGHCLGFFSEKMDKDLLTTLMEDNQKTAIFELEGLAIVAGIDAFSPTIAGKRLVIFTDNEAVQASVIKCRSSNNHMDLVIKRMCSLEENLNIMAWIERVPSFSNPADHPSREVLETYLNSKRIRVDTHALWEKCKAEEKWVSLHVGEGREA